MWRGVPGSIFGTAFNTVLSCLAVAVFLQNLMLLRQNRALRSGVTAPDDLSQGKRLGNLGGVDLNGMLRPIAVPFSGSDRLLIITFSPGCPFCRANQAGWASLTDELRKRSGWRIVWVSRNPVSVTRQYSLAKQIPTTEVLADPPYGTYVQLGLRAVPKTVVVGLKGVVLRSWQGRLSEYEWEQVNEYLGIGETVPAPVAAPSGEAPKPPTPLLILWSKTLIKEEFPW